MYTLENKPRSAAMFAQSPSPDLAQLSFAGATSARVVLVADDLTGACDAGVAFIHSGRSVRVWFSPGVLFSAPESVQAFTTNSRSLSPTRAARVVSRTVSSLGSGSGSLFFKKVDSACRGPLGAEVLAAHHSLSTRAILFAPAFPTAGRIVRDGVLEIHDAAGQSNRVRLVGLFPITVRHRIANVSSPSDLETALESGKTILVCDGASQADLENLARAAQNLPGLLYAGSGGLAQALAGLNFVSQPPALVPAAQRTLIVAGSPHPVTKLQLQTLDRERFSGVRIVKIGIPFADRLRIRSAFRSSSPQALVLTGGETALLAVHALEAHSFILQGEIGPGIPWGLIQGGLAHGCVVVTKSGGFGSSEAFNEILTALQGHA
jgi:D-threonate/D-erythronate kinase